VPIERVRAPSDVQPFADAFARIRSEFDVPASFPAAVDAEAEQQGERGIGDVAGERRDARDVPFVTIDPPGSRDLDQALHVERRNGGYRVHYAIADVAAFVTPGGALDGEAMARGVTIYLPDGRAPMLPNALTQGAASLLPDVERPALWWTIDLDGDGRTTDARVERARVRSRGAYDYPTVQAQLDDGCAPEVFTLLREVGRARLEREAERGGVSLDLPEQEVVADPDGRFTLEYRAPLDVERWNAQISLLTGIAAAAMMIDAGVGIVRTVPEPDDAQLTKLRRTARALGVDWPAEHSWGEVVRSLDRTRDEHAAFLVQAAHLLRGAGYALLDASNTARAADAPVHAGVGAPYAHVTAPLRRNADRFASEIALAHSAGATAPAWATDALPQLVDTMQRALRRDAAVERAVVDAVECALLATRVGERFDGVVLDRNERGVIVQLRSPAVIAHVADDAELGADIEVELAAVDPVARRIDLRPVGT
jgi:VacB/RNase II family 3'-5' exoribonuclease